MVRTNRVAIAIAALLLSSTAWAGNMFLPARGARALGRGGAFTAGVDDGSAIYYNPGGLADIEGISVLVDGALIFQRAGYDRVDSGGNPQPHVLASLVSSFEGFVAANAWGVNLFVVIALAVIGAAFMTARASIVRVGVISRWVSSRAGMSRFASPR